MSETKEKSKSEIAYETIKEEIINNKIKPNTLLVERQLCKSLKISRTPVRSALQKLSEEGLVDFIPDRGCFVSSITYVDLIEIYEMREALEGLAARLCAQNMTANKVERLKFNIEEQRKAVEENDSELYLVKDFEFHRLILEVGGNKRVQNVIKNMMDQIERISNLIKNDSHRIHNSYNQHKATYDAITQGDSQLAEETMKEHIRSAIDYHSKQLVSYKDYMKHL